MKISIFTRLLVNILMVSMIPISLTGYYFSRSASSIIVSNHEKQSKILLEKTASQISAFHDKVLDERPEIGIYGKEALFAHEFQQGLEEVKSTVEKMLARKSYILRLQVFTPDLTPILTVISDSVALSGRPGDLDPGILDKAREILKSGEAKESEPFRSSVLDSKVLSAWLPMTSDEGSVSGLVLVDYALSAFTGYAAIATKPGEDIYVCDTEGRFIYHSKEDKSLKGHLGEGLGRLDGAGKTIYDRVLALGKGHGYFAREGESTYLVHEPVRSLGWNLCLEIPVSIMVRELSHLRKTLIITILMIIIIVSIIVWNLARSFTQPIITIMDSFNRMATGKLNIAVSISRSDEFGVLAESFNKFVVRFHMIVEKISNCASAMSRAAEELNSASSKLASAASDMSEQSETVAAEAEVVSDRMLHVSITTKESSDNITMVATSTEEMTSTIEEIAKNTERVLHVTSDAVKRSNAARDQVGVLQSSAREIDNVIGMIIDIAEQTKLLALNATIEAARAGEAGKGFTVVANEVKELAKQTNSATTDIKDRIGAIQHSTDRTISEIVEVNRVINVVNDFVKNIASAAEEQTITTREIASNIGHAARGVNGITDVIFGASESSKNIARDITGVKNISVDVKAMSAEVRRNALQLTRMGEALNEIVSNFDL